MATAVIPTMEELYLEETRSTQRAAETPAKQLNPTIARETTPHVTSSCALDNNDASSWPCRPPPRRARNPVPPPVLTLSTTNGSTRSASGMMFNVSSKDMALVV